MCWRSTATRSSLIGFGTNSSSAKGRARPTFSTSWRRCSGCFLTNQRLDEAVKFLSIGCPRRSRRSALVSMSSSCQIREVYGQDTSDGSPRIDSRLPDSLCRCSRSSRCRRSSASFAFLAAISSLRCILKVRSIRLQKLVSTFRGLGSCFASVLRRTV